MCRGHGYFLARGDPENDAGSDKIRNHDVDSPRSLASLCVIRDRSLLEVASSISDFLDFLLFFLLWPAFLGLARDCCDRFNCVTDDYDEFRMLPKKFGWLTL